jgi:hypothetical protein
MQIRCRYGLIYPHGGDKLAVEVDYHNQVARMVGRIPGVVQTPGGLTDSAFPTTVL